MKKTILLLLVAALLVFPSGSVLSHHDTTHAGDGSDEAENPVGFS